VGGRFFPGIHHHARFHVRETPEHFEVVLASDDGDTHLSVVADLGERLPATSLFGSLEEASRFFEGGALATPPRPRRSGFQGLELPLPHLASGAAGRPQRAVQLLRRPLALPRGLDHLRPAPS